MASLHCYCCLKPLRTSGRLSICSTACLGLLGRDAQSDDLIRTRLQKHFRPVARDRELASMLRREPLFAGLGEDAVDAGYRVLRLLPVNGDALPLALAQAATAASIADMITAQRWLAAQHHRSTWSTERITAIAVIAADDGFALHDRWRSERVLV
jgi:hypothetical protein